MRSIELIWRICLLAITAGCKVYSAPPSQHLNRYYDSEKAISRANASCVQMQEISALPLEQRISLCKDRYNQYGEHTNRCVSHYLNYRIPQLAAEKNSSGNLKYPGLQSALNAPNSSYFTKYSIHQDDPKTSVNLASELLIDVRPACVLRERPKQLPPEVKSFSQLSPMEKAQWQPFDHKTSYTNLDLTP
jgi:hypothetical protein